MGMDYIYRRPFGMRRKRLYTAGGNIQANIGSGIGGKASAIVQGVGEAVSGLLDTSAKDMAAEQIRNTNNSMQSAPVEDSFDRIMNDSLTANLSHVTARDFRNKGFGQMISENLASADEGFQQGGPWGAVARGAGNLIGSLAGIFKARKQARRVNRQIDYINDFNDRSLDNRTLNAIGNQASSLEALFAAAGGPIHIDPKKKGTFTAAADRNGMGVQAFARHVMANKEDYTPAMRKKANFALNASKWKHGFGGDMSTNGGDFSNGYYTIGNGGTHEENPYEGIMVGMDSNGTPNLVEEGETVYDDYVFSHRLTIPKDMRKRYGIGKKGHPTFADVARRIAKESEERPNDPISNLGLDAMMQDLIADQETIRQRKGLTGNNVFARGGYEDEEDPRLNPAYIDELYHDLNGRDNGTSSTVNNTGTSSTGYAVKSVINSGRNAIKSVAPVNNVGTTSTGTEKEIIPLEKIDFPEALIRDRLFGLQGQGNYVVSNRKPVNPIEAARKDMGRQSGDKKDWMTYLRYAPVAGAGIGVLTDLLGLTNRPDYSAADEITDAAGDTAAGTASFEPIGNYLAYRPFDREFHTNNLRSMAAASRRNLMNTSAGNRATVAANILASDYNTTGQYGALARQAEEYNRNLEQAVENFNRGTNMFNSEGDLKADIANMQRDMNLGERRLKAVATAAGLRDQANARASAARSANLTNLLQGLGDIGNERIQQSWINDNPAFKYWVSLLGRGIGYGKKNGGRIRRR